MNPIGEILALSGRRDTTRYVPDYCLLGDDGYIMGAFTSERPKPEEDALGQFFFQRKPIPIIYEDLGRGVIVAEITPDMLKPDALEFVGTGWRKAGWWTALRWHLGKAFNRKDA